MAVRMTELTHAPNGDWFARKAIPVDIREAYKAVYRVAWEEKFRRPSSLSQSQAKQEFREWDALITSRILDLRAKAKGEGRTLTHKETIGLCGEWYRWFVGKHEDNPGSPERWDDWHERFRDAYERWAGSDDPDWEPSPVVRRYVRATVSGLADIPHFLSLKGVELSQESLDRFLDALEDEFVTALATLRRRAEGDYGTDPNTAKFPKFVPAKASGFTAWTLFDAWVKEKKPANQTVDRWRGIFLDLEAKFPERDASSITEEEAKDWARKSVTEERSAQTVAQVWVNAAKTIFNWGKEMRHTQSNPFEGVKITVPKKVRIREHKSFTDEEWTKILKATTKEQPERLAEHYKAARRWVPWLCAYSGARSGEITQLRGLDIIERDGVWAIKLTPEAGTIKNGEARTIPIHDHLIAQGFIEFVRAKGDGPLFYDPTARRKQAPVDPTKPGQAQSIKTRNHLAEWVRKVGVKDPELSPNHAWRHTFKMIADRVGISERVSDAITGHAPLNEARAYGKPTVADMAAALNRFPTYVLM